MEDALIQLLSTFGYPVIRQGSLAPNQAYPDTFITFWSSEEYGNSFYDNSTASVVFDYDVNVYSTSPDTVYSTLASVRTALKAAGWIISSRGRDVGSDEPTHVGRGFNVQYLTCDPNNIEGGTNENG